MRKTNERKQRARNCSPPEERGTKLGLALGTLIVWFSFLPKIGILILWRLRKGL